MNKGKAIRRLIEEGRDDSSILSQVATTANSIRWHRSKMKAGPSVKKPRTAKEADFLTVGAALERFGLADEVRTCIKRLKVDNPDGIYANLASWSFVTNARASGRYGQCNYTRRKIEVSTTLLDLADDLRQTFLHECAHALDFLIHGRTSGHGAEWKWIMSGGFRISSKRCSNHSEEASKALQSLNTRKAVETWICKRCGGETPIKRKRKYPAESYRHRGCGGNYRVK